MHVRGEVLNPSAVQHRVRFGIALGLYKSWSIPLEEQFLAHTQQKPITPSKARIEGIYDSETLAFISL